jgi:hypothetical protein
LIRGRVSAIRLLFSDIYFYNNCLYKSTQIKIQS